MKEREKTEVTAEELEAMLDELEAKLAAGDDKEDEEGSHDAGKNVL